MYICNINAYFNFFFWNFRKSRLDGSCFGIQQFLGFPELLQGNFAIICSVWKGQFFVVVVEWKAPKMSVYDVGIALLGQPVALRKCNTKYFRYNSILLRFLLIKLEPSPPNFLLSRKKFGIHQCINRPEALIRSLISHTLTGRQIIYRF